MQHRQLFGRASELELLLGCAAAPSSADAEAAKLPAPAPAAGSCTLLVDHLVKPGPSGTVASTAAAASAARAALITAAPDVGPAGLLGCHKAGKPGVMQDLLAAAEKALASGLGDWHLQMLQDISPLFQQHVLMGPLGPETLKHRHRLPEAQILALYGLLHRHCTGFQQEVQQALAGAQDMEQLLASVWVAFAQLWDECVQMSFQGEVLAAMQELQGVYGALLEAQEQLAATQQENATLQERCNDFVRANLGHMLAWRSLKSKADALEGEVAMLSAANTQVSLRAAATNARNTQLTVQLEGLGARLAAAEQQIEDREAGLAAARAALLEKDSGLRRLDAQVAQLEQQLMQAGRAGQRQGDAISDLRRQLDLKEQLVADAERRVADKQRAFNLLHADFAKQKAEAAEMSDKAQELRQQLVAMRQQQVAAQALAAQAQAQQRRFEELQMRVEDLQAANSRATMRRHEIVSSFWPVMQRLGEAEDAVAALSRQVQALGQQPVAVLQPRDSRAAEFVLPGDAAAAAAAVAVVPPTTTSSQQPGGSAAEPLQASQRQAATPGSRADSSTEDSTPAAAAAAAAAAAGSGSSQDVDEHKQQQQEPGQQLAASWPLVSTHLDKTLQEELQQLRESYLLIQDAYWQQKDRLLALEIELSQLHATTNQALATAAQASAALSGAQEEAARQAAMRLKLEADVVGCKSWIRELEQTEQKFLAAIRQQGGLEDAAVSAERQAQEARTALAAAEANCQLAQAHAHALETERRQLLQQLAQELNKSNLVEQAMQRVHKQELSSSRAASSRLQAALDLSHAHLAAVQAQLADARQQCGDAAAERDLQKAQLQQATLGNDQLRQRLKQAQAFLQDTLQHLERLEARSSFVNASSIASIASSAPGEGQQTVEQAAEAALHLLERLLVALQCLAADAATISNAAAVAKIEVLVVAIMEGLLAAARAAAQQAAGGASRPSGVAMLTVLRNAVSGSASQRLSELERQVPMLQLQLADCSAQLSAAESARSRLERCLMLKTRLAASMQRQLAAAESQMAQQQRSLSGSEEQLQLLHADLADARLGLARAQAAAGSAACELKAADDRAASAEAQLEQQQQAAVEAGAASAAVMEHLQQAVEASRQDALKARTAAAAAAVAEQQAQQLQAQLAAATARIQGLESDVKQCQQRADICTTSAREAEYRAAQTHTLLADTRRELDFTQHLLQQQQQQHDDKAVR